MKILFIRPNPPEETIGLQHLMIVEPLELEILATLVESQHEVIIIDLILEDQPLDYFIRLHKPDVVCVTGYITHTIVMQEVCEKAKSINPDIITIVGGVHVEQLPDTIDHNSIDFRIVRNATRAFPDLVKYIENSNQEFPKGVLRKGEQSNESSLPDYDFYVPIPNRTLTKKYRKKYFYVYHDKVALLKTSFGCPYTCNFCYCRTIAGNKYYERDLEDVINELKAIQEKEVYIIDDDFLVSRKRLTAFMDLLEKNHIKKKYLIYGRADFIVDNPDLLGRFKNLGLRTIIVGLESFSNHELNALNKRSSTSINEQTMNILNRIGVDCYASMIAMPEWKKEDFRFVTEKMVELKIRFLNIQPLTPLLKTDIAFDDTQLIVSREDYPKWDLAHVVVKPKYLSVEAYYKEIIKMYQRILFRPSNFIHNFRYSIRMQLKLFSGVLKVKNQYIRKLTN